MKSSVLSRRRFCAILATATGLIGGCASAAPTAGPSTLGPVVLPTATASPAPGRLLITHGGNLFVFDLRSLEAAQLSHLPAGTYASMPALSPDRTRIAYAYFVPPSDEKDLGGNDLAVMDVTGADPRVIRAHDKSGTSFEEPCWTGDGSALLATRRTPISDQGRLTGTRVDVVRVSLDGGEVEQLVEGGQSPATSVDGNHLTYLTRDETGLTKRLWIADGDGRKPSELLVNSGFSLIRSPTFAPDNGRLAFAAVGNSPTSRLPHQEGAASTRFAFFGPRVAEAHGVPWEIWTVRTDGSDLRRLTQIREDSPIPVWSPDGQWIAFSGEIGLYIVDAAGQQTTRLSEDPSAGGLVWLS